MHATIIFCAVVVSFYYTFRNPKTISSTPEEENRVQNRQRLQTASHQTSKSVTKKQKKIPRQRTPVNINRNQLEKLKG